MPSRAGAAGASAAGLMPLILSYLADKNIQQQHGDYVDAAFGGDNQ